MTSTSSRLRHCVWLASGEAPVYCDRTWVNAAYVAKRLSAIFRLRTIVASGAEPPNWGKAITHSFTNGRADHHYTSRSMRDLEHLRTVSLRGVLER